MPNLKGKPMKTLFDLNLCRALAHTLVLENQLPGVPAGFFRNDMGTSYSPPNPAKTAVNTMLAQEQAMTGTGKFAQFGPLPDLMMSFMPKYNEIGLRNQYDYLNGVNGAPGMLDMYVNNIAPAMAQVQSISRAADFADMERLGPEAMRAMRAYNPAGAGLVDSLTADASQQMSLDGALDPFTKRMLAQDVRSGQAARGMGTGYSDAAAEAYYQDASREQRRTQGRQLATSAAALSNSFYGDPFQTVLGRNNFGGTMAAYGQGMNGSGAATSPVYGAFTMPSGADMWSTLYGANNQANAYHAQAQNDLMGGLIGGAFGLGGAGMKAFAMCWSARAIFGAANPRWLRFRKWVLREAPAKFRCWYAVHGKRWAQRIQAMPPETRSAIRRWMISKINLLPQEAL